MEYAGQLSEIPLRLDVKDKIQDGPVGLVVHNSGDNALEALSSD
jgi:hypothetical protein